MNPPQPPGTALDALGAFTVSIDYGRARTTFNVHAKGDGEPVARMHKDGAYDSLHPFQVLTGPLPGELAGYVTPLSAMTADRIEIGTVRFSEGSLRNDEWRFAQYDLGTLTGLPKGLSSKLRHGSPLRLIPFHELSDTVFARRLIFRAPESPGFELARLAGVRARYDVKIHDPRVSRLLVLACVAHFNRYAAVDPRKTAVDYTANPFK